MHIRITTFLLTLFCCISAYGQVGFERYYGSSSCYEEGASVISLGQTGYLVSAAYNCGGGVKNWDSYLLRLDTNGDTLWSVKGLPYNGHLRLTSDHNYLYAGGNIANNVYDTIKVVKVETNGNILWSSNIAIGACANIVTDITEINNGYMLTGYFMNGGTCTSPIFDGFVAQLDLNGNLLWHVVIGGAGQDQLHAIKAMPDGKMYAVGWTNTDVNNNLNQYLLVKLDAKGSVLWRKQFGNEYNNFAYGLDACYNGGVVVNGYSEGHNMELYAISPESDIVWHKEYGTACGSTYFKVAKTQDGGYALLGTEDVNNSCKAVFLKTDAEGNLLWKRNWNARLRQFQENADSSFVLTGYVSGLNDAVVILFDSTRIEKHVELPIDTITQDTTIVDTAEVIISPLDTMDIQTSVDEFELNERFVTANLFPNPVRTDLNIEISNPDRIEYMIQIYSVTGKLVYVNTFNGEQHQINVSSLSAGSYIYKLNATGFAQAGQFIVEK